MSLGPRNQVAAASVALLIGLLGTSTTAAQSATGQDGRQQTQRLRGVDAFLGRSNHTTLFDQLVGAPRGARAGAAREPVRSGGSAPARPTGRPRTGASPTQVAATGAASRSLARAGTSAGEPTDIRIVPDDTARAATPRRPRGAMPPATLTPGRGVVIGSSHTSAGSAGVVSTPVRWRRGSWQTEGATMAPPTSTPRRFSSTGPQRPGATIVAHGGLPADPVVAVVDPPRLQRAAAPAIGAATADVYRIGPGDTLEIFVWRNPELTRKVPVRPDGRISMPLLGEIVVEGMTAEQLQELLRSRLAEFIQAPNVSVSVSDIRSQVIYVLGRVGKPGPLQLTRPVTVLQALAMAGGLAEFADKDGITILRTVGGRQIRIPYRYDDVVKGKGAGADIVLQAGDVIFVP